MRQKASRKYQLATDYFRLVAPGEWAIRGAGAMYGGPSDIPMNAKLDMVLTALRRDGIEVSHTSSGSPANADSYTFQATYSGNSSALRDGILESLCVHGLRREAIWTDNLAQDVRWAADSARLRPDDHALVLSTYTLGVTMTARLKSALAGSITEENRMSDPNSERSTGTKVAIAVAVIGLLGTLGGALIANLDKLRGTEDSGVTNMGRLSLVLTATEAISLQIRSGLRALKPAAAFAASRWPAGP